MKVTFAQIDRGQKLAAELIKKADLNTDGSIREGDLTKLRAAAKKNAIMSEFVAVLDPLRKYASKTGGPTPKNVAKALGTAATKLKARDKDGSKALEDKEQVKSMTVMESQLLRFAGTTKKKKASDFKFPKAYVAKPPSFNRAGTPEKVCQSLLDAFSKPGNDSFWPAWAHSSDQPRASRYVIDGTEARAMVAALKKLYPSRQKAITTELANRTAHSTYGCASPTDAGKRVLEAYATQIGVSVTFHQPAAPALHVS